jgi:hypothetical protein
MSNHHTLDDHPAAGEPPAIKHPPCTATGPAYHPPRLLVLGSVSELTRGGTTGPSDGYGYAGASGNLP